jgi:hypothetical protein
MPKLIKSPISIPVTRPCFVGAKGLWAEDVRVLTRLLVLPGGGMVTGAAESMVDARDVTVES